MNPIKLFCLLTCLVAAVAAVPGKKGRENHGSGSGTGTDSSLSPSQWITPSELQSIPAINQVTLQSLEKMSLEKGAQLIEQIYHLSQINHQLRPTFVPSPTNIPVYIWKNSGEKVATTLSNFASVAKQQSEFGNDEVTIVITGLPSVSSAVRKANQQLVQAYLQRNNVQEQRKQQNNADYVDSGYGNNEQQPTTNEEDYSESSQQGNPTTGDLVVIDLGATLTNFERVAMVDIEQVGQQIANALVSLTNSNNVLHENIHIVAQGVAAHVAGAAANEYTRVTGHKLRRITALDPSKIFSKQPNTLVSLSPGDADFVDAIHTSSYGLGSPMKVADVDFYPNGPSAGVPGADDVIEATMRATQYFAESVRPGNERNFPAVPANSLKDYQQNNGNGKRTYMGIDVDYDLEGDYMLQVNPKSPFGQRTPATKQASYHGQHSQAWQNNQQNQQGVGRPRLFV